mgnify:CR=1 FL=1
MATHLAKQMVFLQTVTHLEMPKASPRLDYQTGNLKGMHLEFLQMGCQMGFHLGMQTVCPR